MDGWSDTGELVAFDIRFVNPGHTQRPPQISISVAQSPWEVLGSSASSDQRPLLVRMWYEAVHLHTTAS